MQRNVYKSTKFIVASAASHPMTKSWVMTSSAMVFRVRAALPSPRKRAVFQMYMLESVVSWTLNMICWTRSAICLGSTHCFHEDVARPKEETVIGVWKMIAVAMIRMSSSRKVRGLQPVRWRREYRTTEKPQSLMFQPTVPMKVYKTRGQVGANICSMLKPMTWRIMPHVVRRQDQ